LTFASYPCYAFVSQLVLALTNALVQRSLFTVRQNALHLIGVDNARDVGVSHNGPGKSVALLERGTAHVRAKQLSQTLERRLGVGHEATEGAARRQLQQVQTVDVTHLHTGKVAEGLSQESWKKGGL
jgi:hypothetical protein